MRVLIQCPGCSFKTVESAAKTGLREYSCPACEALLQADISQCCVLCAYGDKPCLAALKRGENTSEKD